MSIALHSGGRKTPPLSVLGFVKLGMNMVQRKQKTVCEYVVAYDVSWCSDDVI